MGPHPLMACSVRISPRVSREKQNSNCVREKYLYCETVDNLAQQWQIQDFPEVGVPTPQGGAKI